MSGQINPSVLKRMVGTGTVAVTEVPVTASRAMRLAVTRAAERTVGLQLTVIGVEEESLALEGVQEALRDDLLLLKLVAGDGGIVGVLALDCAFVAAIVEVQTTGQVGSIVPEARPVTLADLVLTQPMLDGVFAQLLETTQNTALDDWTTDVRQADRFEDVRAIGLALAHVNYRLMRLTLDLGGTERQGEFLLALPWGEDVAPPSASTPKIVDWTGELKATIFEAPAALSAVLHRFEIPLQTANALSVGQVLPLPGCTVNSVQLVGPDGVRVARAKLGQVAGHIAVRLENPIAPALKELPPHKMIAETDVVLEMSEDPV